MKAKEYSDQFLIQFIIDEKKAVENLIIGLLTEGQEIIKQRHVKKESAVMSILREQNLKYKSCCNMINKQYPVLRLDGYEQILKHKMGISI